MSGMFCVALFPVYRWHGTVALGWSAYNCEFVPLANWAIVMASVEKKLTLFGDWRDSINRTDPVRQFDEAIYVIRISGGEVRLPPMGIANNNGLPAAAQNKC
jgi:hypothetical protein